MGNNKMIVEERSREIGNFLVGRLLPFRKKRQVGPFTFIDHMGPATFSPPDFLDVDQHPHIGLCTLTYLLEGQIEHKDSTGAHQIIEAGDIGFMSSGRGVTHTERTPLALRDGNSFTMHGYQVWVALPKDKEEMSPRFDYLKKSRLPSWDENGLRLTLLAGEGYGRQSPLPVHSPLFMLDVIAESDTCLEIKGQLEGEIAFVVTKGQVIDGSDVIESGQMLISKTEDECYINLEKGTRLLIFGGPALEEERYLYWNFVSSSKERLEKAKNDWKAMNFPKVKGDDTYIPLPMIR